MKSDGDQDRSSRPTLTISLCGDVMTGRGIDQILPHPGNPQLYEPFVKDARGYIQIAEQANGAIRRPVSYNYIWGDALAVWNSMAPDARIVNLETAITGSENAWPEKGIHYRMHPENVDCIAAAEIDCCVVANNHVLDWGYEGLSETISALQYRGIKVAGAGENVLEAERPTVLECTERSRVLVFAFGSESSGIPREWAATTNRAGVNLLSGDPDKDLDRVRRCVAAFKREFDVVIASIHWGPNWGYRVTRQEEAFARALIDDAQVDVVYGHSSHHVKRIENYRNRLILYGCGDFLDDYEGIGGHEEFRGDLGLMYFVTVESSTGNMVGLQLVPMQMRRMRLCTPRRADVRWLKDRINRESGEFGICVEETDNRSWPMLEPVNLPRAPQPP